jgi:hypothetical protein
VRRDKAQTDFAGDEITDGEKDQGGQVNEPVWRAVEIAGMNKRVCPVGRQAGSYLTLSGGCEFSGNSKKKVVPWFGSLT